MVVIRLSRGGAKARPFFNIVVADKRTRRDGRFIERIGFYNPIAKDNEESIRIAQDRLTYWRGVGATPSPTVERLLKQAAAKTRGLSRDAVAPRRSAVACRLDLTPRNCPRTRSKSGASPMPGASRAGSRSCPTALRPEALFSSKRWFLLPSERGAKTFSGTALLRVREAKEHSDTVVASAHDVDDRSAAEALKGARIFIPRSSFPTAATDEYYWVDLIGLDVVNREGVALGQVKELLSTGPQTVLVIEYQEGDKAAGAHDSLRLGLCRRRRPGRASASRSTGRPTTSAAGPCGLTSRHALRRHHALSRAVRAFPRERRDPPRLRVQAGRRPSVESRATSPRATTAVWMTAPSAAGRAW